MKSFILPLFMLLLTSNWTWACDELNRDIRAHKTTWTTLMALDQVEVVFSEAGSIRVGNLPILSSATLANPSFELAQLLDGIFVNLRRAERNVGDAVEVSARLIEQNEHSTLCSLAEQLDDVYTFWDE